MKTLGIDLATEGSTTGVCEIDWAARGAPTITYLDSGKAISKDFTTVALAKRVHHVIDAEGGWAGIDAPFGFPKRFTEMVNQWSEQGATGNVGSPAGEDSEEARVCRSGARHLWNPINRRITDAHVEARIHELREAHPDAGGWQSWPLSSVVERITPTVMRCAELLTNAVAVPVDRVGFDSHVIETYPIAALRLWLSEHDTGWSCLWGALNADGTKRPGYKDDKWGTSARTTLVDVLLGATGVKADDDQTERMSNSHDLVDAFVCALVARLAARADKPTQAPPELADFTDTIDLEGWIHLPSVGAGLDTLAAQE